MKVLIRLLKNILLIPKWRQLKAWSLPSKATYFSFWLAIITLIITVSIFEFQEKFFRHLNYIDIWVPRLEDKDTNFIRKTNAKSLDAFLSNTLSEQSCIKEPSILIGRKGIDFVVYKDCGLTGTAQIFTDGSLKNRVPELKVTEEHGIIQTLEYVEYAKDRDKGILIKSISGGSGRGLQINLFVRLRTGEYLDLFRDNDLSNNEHVFVDIDGDGIRELITIEVCAIKFYKLDYFLRMSPISPRTRGYEKLLNALPNLLEGGQFLNHFRKWESYGCPPIMDDGGMLFDELTEDDKRHKENVKDYQDLMTQ